MTSRCVIVGQPFAAGLSVSLQGTVMPLQLLRFVLLTLTVLYVVFPSTVAVAASPAAVAAPATTSFEDLGYGDLTARGIHSTLDYFFPIPQGHSPQKGAQLDLVVSHSPLLLPTRSTMTVLLNGTPLLSHALNDANQNQARIRVPLPTAHTQSDGLFVQVQFSMRLTNETCEDPHNVGLWATVHRESSLKMPLAWQAEDATLDQLEGLFTPSTTQTPTTTLVLPPAATSEELQAAGLVAFQLGRWAATQGRDVALEVAASTAADSPAILVGQAGSVAGDSAWGNLHWNETAFAHGDRVVSADYGVLALAADTPAPHLLVSGATPGAVQHAAAALVDPARQRLLGGSEVVVSGVPAVAVGTPPWQKGAASFAQLGRSEQRVVGSGEHIIPMSFARPADWILREGSSLQLDLDVAPAIRPETSWVSVSVNGQSIGTQPLRPGDAVQRYSFALPADLLTADAQGQPLRQLDLQVRLFLDQPERECLAIADDATWATLLPTSAWLLPHDQFDGLSLGRFPAPLLAVDTSEPLLVVMPAQPSATELAQGLRIMAALGRWGDAGANTLPQLTTADRVGEAERQHHLIVLGAPQRNAISAALAPLAPQLFALDKAAVMRDTDETHRAQLALAPSPWANGQAVLAISGAETGDSDLAVAALTQGALLRQLRGARALLVEGVPPAPLDVATEAEAPPATLAPRVVTPIVAQLPTWQIVGAILLGAFVAAMLLIGRARWGRRGTV
jgi:cellulose synthase operon protein B